MATLTTQLNNGDIVEIITSSQSKGPSLDWLKIVKTVEARNKIKAFFKKETKEENIKMGKSMIEQAVKNQNYNLTKLLECGGEKLVLDRFYLNTMDEIYSAVGYGSLSINSITNILINNYKKINHLNELKQSSEKQISYNLHEANMVCVEGGSNLLISFAKCCSPVPGDDIIGFISHGRGIIVHRKSCANIKGFSQDRLIEVNWLENKNSNFLCRLNIVAKNKDNILPVIASKLSDFKVNLKALNSQVTNNDEMQISLQVLVKEQSEISYLITKIKDLENVLDVYRVNN